MKIIFFIVVALSFYSSAMSECTKNCTDKEAKCAYLGNFCTNPIVESLCPKTCGVCTLCPVTERLSNCEMGTCKDHLSTIVCSLYKKHRYGCLFAGVRCPLTCGLCQNCKLPPTKPAEPEKPACTDDCFDEHPACTYWEENGFCDPENGYEDTRDVCPKSCGVCSLCPVKKPVLPPIRQEKKLL